jgi:hypothetical protein
MQENPTIHLESHLPVRSLRILPFLQQMSSRRRFDLGSANNGKVECPVRRQRILRFGNGLSQVRALPAASAAVAQR